MIEWTNIYAPVSVVANLATAAAVVFVAWQLILNRRLARREACFRLYESFVVSQDIATFRTRINFDPTNVHELDRFLAELDSSTIPQQSLHVSGTFLRYICLLVDQKHADPNDVANTIGWWLKNCENLKKAAADRIRNGRGGLQYKNELLLRRLRCCLPQLPEVLEIEVDKLA